MSVGPHNSRHSPVDSDGVFEAGPDTKLNHEHVIERKKLVNRMLAGEPVAKVLKAAIACIVTVTEHRLLTDLSRTQPDLEGWERYEAAGIKVVDRSSKP